jgi:hypothetical protein
VKDPEKKESFWSFIDHPAEVLGGQKNTNTATNQTVDSAKSGADKTPSSAPPANADKPGFFSKVTDMISGR